MKHYAFQYTSGRNTTTGSGNEKTGKHSIAGHLAVFSSKNDRDEWVARGKVTSDMRGNCREVVTAREARELKCGQTLAQFNEEVDFSLDAEV